MRRVPIIILSDAVLGVRRLLNVLHADVLADLVRVKSRLDHVLRPTFELGGTVSGHLVWAQRATYSWRYHLIVQHVLFTAEVFGVHRQSFREGRLTALKATRYLRRHH